MTSRFGTRESPAAGAGTWHPAVDLPNWLNPCGRPVYAMVPGEVTLSSALFLSIKTPEGFTVSYLHMYKSDRIVDVGDQIAASQQIGAMGNVAPSSGCHLDIRVNVAGNTNPEVAKLRVYDAAGGGCVNPIEVFPLFGIEICPADNCSHV
ncbi:M23 family metallopeptidase [Labedella populi]|uniref:M23 family metallopeptidase n=1 Tax=Labedella populi TaxID=2498850 RepID=A0A444QE55_9MICO|nr:M23 family metallopeptidase [Labedella populi]RWZ67862.1 M23 family metallopeptidase [Labedella populi]